jgi:glycosyltransferase involved in cell wall biosynthesis
MASQSIWIVTDQLPFPPRNGITLPLFHYASLLSKDNTVHIVLLVDVDAPPAADAIRDNEEQFGPVLQVRLRRREKFRRMRDELLGIEMFQHGWDLAQPMAWSPLQAADALVVSPMSAVAKWRSVSVDAPALDCAKIAAVNDCTTAEYFFRHLSAQPNRSAAIKARIDYLRTRKIAAIERELLAPYHHVILQTPRDRELMAELVAPDTAAKVQVIPNGVSESYLALVRKPRNQILFVGELSGEYDATARWLLTEVWPHVVANPAAKQAGVELLFVGRGASASLRALMQSTPSVAYIDYVKNLGDVYAAAMIALSPVFKGFGLINKTIEAMASGVPVVGGTAAFNGISGFRSGAHGIACGDHSAADFVSALNGLIADADLRVQIGAQAKALVKGQFCWNSAATRLGELATLSRVEGWS